MPSGWRGNPSPSPRAPASRCKPCSGPFADIRKHDILDFWRDRLQNPLEKSRYRELIAEGLQPGAADFFLVAARGDRRYPALGNLRPLCLAPSFFLSGLSTEPVGNSDLPTLIYVGSGTATADQYTGGESRARGHLGFFRNGG